MILAVTLNPAVDYTVFGGALALHETNRGRDIPPDPGGKGNNAARVCRLLGFDTVATGILGGHTGGFIRERLEGEGIVTEFFSVPSPTRITLSFIEEESGRDTKIVLSGSRLDAATGESFLSHYRALLKKHSFDIIMLGGSLPLGLPDNYYGMLIDAAAAHGTRVILDTSGAPLKRALGHDPFMITPNLQEARELCGSPDREIVIEHLCALSGRIGLAALTLGAEGAVYCIDGKPVKIQPPRVKTVNPVGAGDAFAAGLACAYARYGFDPPMLYRWSLAAGACTAQSAGITWETSVFDRMLAEIEDGIPH